MWKLPAVKTLFVDQWILCCGLFLIVMLFWLTATNQKCFAVQFSTEQAHPVDRHENGLETEIQFPDSVVVESIEVEFVRPNFGDNGFPEKIAGITPSLIRVQGKIKLNAEIKEVLRTKQNGKIKFSLEFVRYQPAAEYARAWRRFKGIVIEQDQRFDHADKGAEQDEDEFKSEHDRFFANNLLPEDLKPNRIEQSTTLAIEFSIPANKEGKVVLEQDFDQWLAVEKDLTEQHIFVVRFNPKVEHDCKHFGVMYVPSGIRNSIEERRARMRLLSYIPLAISLLESLLNPVKAIESLREWMDFQID